MRLFYRHGGRGPALFSWTVGEGFDTFGPMRTLPERIADELRGLRPVVEGDALRLWGDIVVALARALGLDGDDRADFFGRAGGL
jgi:hypothetical protein